MGVEVAGSDVPKVNGDAKDNGKIDFSEVITFGSHGVDEIPSNGEMKDVSNADFAKDAVDEWPEAAQTYQFWFVKYRPYDDPNLKAKMDQIEKDIQKKKQQIDDLYENLNAKKSEKYELINELKAFNEESSQHWAFINEKREAMRPLQSALGSLRGGGGGGEKGVGICSSEEELNRLIKSLEYRMQHESMPLKEEKQLIREIKELEATRPKVIANGAMRAKIQESMGQKETIQDQVKLLGTDLDGVRKQQAAIKAKKDRLTPQLDALKAQIDALQKELSSLKEKKNAAFDTKQELKKKREKVNENFYNSRNVLNDAKNLAIKKDVKALEELYRAEAEKFMSQWNNSKAFRDDYEKRLLQSLDYRQLSRDGRIRNFDEKPLLKPESPSEIDVAPKVAPKQPKEVAKSPSKAETLPVEKPQKESKKGIKESKTASEQAPEEEEVFKVEKPKKDLSKENVDAAKLKEMKREEEMEKQRQALERKKKQQEKNAAKAALKAQKEAEKKQKEWVFALSLLALTPLAERVSFLTEQIAFFTGPTVGGLLNATCGNATEMIIAILALSQNKIEVVKYSLLGSILSNLLLVLGTSLFCGGLANLNKHQKFDRKQADVNSILLLLGLLCHILPLLLNSGAKTAAEVAALPTLTLSRICSIVMLLAYCAYLVFQLWTHRQFFEAQEDSEEEGAEGSEEVAVIGFWSGFAWLVGMTVVIALLSEYVVGTIEAASDSWGISVSFISIILLPIVGNAAEHAGAVIFAFKNKLDITLGVALGSATQISMFVVPLCVIVSWIMGVNMDLDFNTIETGSLAISIIVTAFTLQDGTSHYMKGLVLLLCYIVIGACFAVLGTPLVQPKNIMNAANASTNNIVF